MYLAESYNSIQQFKKKKTARKSKYFICIIEL